MSVIHMQRITNALRQLFEGVIDLSDLEERNEQERHEAFLSRALAAYAILINVEAEPNDAARAVTDGFDDNGIDALYYDRPGNMLYVGQSKWIHSGRGSLSQTRSKSLFDGFRDLVNLRLDRFNDKIRDHADELRAALYDSSVRFTLILAHTGMESVSEHVTRDIDTFSAEMNAPDEVVSVQVYNQGAIYDAVAGHAQRKVIDLEIALHNWGCTSEPYRAFYGQVAATDVTEWWTRHERDLFTKNIRSFRGSTDVNLALRETLRSEPQHFWYFNNGITILCAKISKKSIGGASRETGIFDCEGVAVVNGAQTVGMIGMTNSRQSESLESARGPIRLISLEDCPPGFDKRLTRAANTQNRIERRDFASLDSNQRRLASELHLDGKRYAFKTGEHDPPPAEGCTLVDATVALACASADLALAVQAKREIGRLWEDIEQPPYTTLFNDRTSGTALWRAVKIMRSVDARLFASRSLSYPRAEPVAVHGNRFILYRVFEDPDIRAFRADDTDMTTILARADTVTRTIFESVANDLDVSHPTAYLASFFKNLQRCRELDERLAARPSARSEPAPVPPATPHTRPEDPRLFPE